MTARPLLAMLEKPVLIRLWRINVGTGFNAPPMTFGSTASNTSKQRLGFMPELREQRNQTMLFVFGL